MKKCLLVFALLMLSATVCFAQPYGGSSGSLGQRDFGGGQYGSGFDRGRFGESERQFDYPGPQQYGLGQQYGPEQYGYGQQYGQDSNGPGSQPYGSQQYGSGSPFGYEGGTGQPPYGSDYGRRQFGGGLEQQYGTQQDYDFGSGRRFGRFGDRFGDPSAPGLGSQQEYGGSSGLGSGTGSPFGGSGPGSQFGGTGQFGGSTGRSGGMSR